MEKKSKSPKAGNIIMISVTAVILLFSLFVISPFSNRYLSLAVMSVYSAYCAKDGIPKTDGIDIKIPGGSLLSKGWYPYVATFTPGESFGDAVGRPGVSLTILYNNADFDALKGCSRIYDAEDPLYSSFYGAYFVKCEDGRAYGFTSDEKGAKTLCLDELADVTRYDYEELVLAGFGIPWEKAVFEFKPTASESGVSCAGSDGWIRIDAEMTVNGCRHRRTEFRISYLAYGSPVYDGSEDFAPVTMYGRMYGKFLEERGVSVFFYVIAADRAQLEECDRTILSKSTLKY